MIIKYQTFHLYVSTFIFIIELYLLLYIYYTLGVAVGGSLDSEGSSGEGIYPEGAGYQDQRETPGCQRVRSLQGHP